MKIKVLGSSPMGRALEVLNDESYIRRNWLEVRGVEVNKVDIYGRTPLLIFLQREDCTVGIVEAMLDYKADVNRMDKYGDYPLVAAIRNAKDDAVIRLLIERGAEVNDLRDLHNTPLLVLLRERKSCSVDTVRFLLAKGADVNCVDKDGDSPLVIALKQSRDEAVIQALLEGGADVNMVGKYGETPLYFYLKRYDCSVGIVKLLLCYKADVNSMSISVNSPLLIALKTSKSEAVIQALLEGGAGVDTLDAVDMSPLCIAFRHSSNDIQKLLLDAGSSLNACKFHRNALYCATSFSHSGLREDILTILLETNINVNSEYFCGRSFMCYALENGAKLQDIHLLLNSGASLNICKGHYLPLICATTYTHTPLKEDVVQLFLSCGSYVGDKGLRVLQGALHVCNYETRAIELLLDLPGMDANVAVHDESLLHLAVQNPNCRLDAVKLLVNRKAQVHKANRFGDTPLHCSVRNKRCDASVINFLLQNGSLVNAKNKYDETPLMVAVKEHRPANILKCLLIAGAHIGKAKFSNGDSPFKYELLEFLARQYDCCSDPKTLDIYRILVKFFLLEKPESDVGHFERASAVKFWCRNKLLIFTNECLRELEKMDSLHIGHGHTLRMFVNGCLSVEKIDDLESMMIYLTKNKFPVFCDVISARIDRSILVAELKRIQVYASTNHPDVLQTERVRLNCDVVRKISQYLPDDDLFKFILAFYKPGNQNKRCEASNDNTLLGKRNSEPLSRPHKLPKLCR